MPLRSNGLLLQPFSSSMKTSNWTEIERLSKLWIPVFWKKNSNFPPSWYKKGRARKKFSTGQSVAQLENRTMTLLWSCFKKQKKNQNLPKKWIKNEVHPLNEKKGFLYFFLDSNQNKILKHWLNYLVC